MVAQQIAFGITAFATAVGAVRVVTTKNVVHAALWLMLVLAGVAANFILLAAEFVAVVQVLVYIGAIVVLFLFGIMLTRAPIGREPGLDNSQRLASLVAVTPGQEHAALRQTRWPGLAGKLQPVRIQVDVVSSAKHGTTHTMGPCS